MLWAAKWVRSRHNYRGERDQPLKDRVRFIEAAHMRVAGHQRAIRWCERRDLLEGDSQHPQRILEAMTDEMSHAHSGQMEPPLTARIETHRGLEMLDRQLRLTGEQAQPAAPIPAIGEARIEYESAIDQREGGIDILAKTPE